MNFPLDPTDGWAARVFFFFFQVGLLNVDGYYNSLLTFIDKAVEEGFINPSARRIIVLAPTAQELMDKLEVRDDGRTHAHGRTAGPFSFSLMSSQAC
jgi:hypothetical protein